MKGFTLIEVISAMAVIAIGLVSLLALFPTGIGLNQQSAGTTTAILLCKEMMEEIKTAASSMKDSSPLAEPVYYYDLFTRGDGKWYDFKKYVNAREVFPQNDLYEVSINQTDNIPGFGPPDSNSDYILVRVAVTAFWPKVTGSGAAANEARRTQNSVKLVSYIKCRQKVLVGP